MKKIIFFLLIFISFDIFAQDKGIITGIVTDKETQKPVTDAIVEIIELNKKSASDNEGKFEFKNIPYGTYRVQVTSLGYEAVTMTDIVVLSSRPANVDIAMNPLSYSTDEIDVETRYFQKSNDQSTSIFNLDFEEGFVESLWPENLGKVHGMGTIFNRFPEPLPRISGVDL